MLKLRTETAERNDYQQRKEVEYMYPVYSSIELCEQSNFLYKRGFRVQPST